MYVAGWIFCNGAQGLLLEKRSADRSHSDAWHRLSPIHFCLRDQCVCGRLDRLSRLHNPLLLEERGVHRTESVGGVGHGESYLRSDDDVYVSGETNVSVNANPGIAIPCYWKNGARTDLSVIDPLREGYASAICFSADNVYVAGSVVDTEHSGVPCYWVNGTRIDLSRLCAYTGWAESIQVSGSDVYVGGATQSATTEIIPCYWKNDKRTDLSVVSPGKGGYVNSLFVLGNDVFAAGYGGLDPEPGGRLCRALLLEERSAGRSQYGDVSRGYCDRDPRGLQIGGEPAPSIFSRRPFSRAGRPGAFPRSTWAGANTAGTRWSGWRGRWRRCAAPRRSRTSP